MKISIFVVSVEKLTLGECRLLALLFCFYSNSLAVCVQHRNGFTVHERHGCCFHGNDNAFKEKKKKKKKQVSVNRYVELK